MHEETYDGEGDEWVDGMLEDDEIDAGEAGFIAGYTMAEEECFD